MKHLFVFFSLCFNVIIANAQSFDAEIKALSSSIVETVDVDARRFDSCINVIEARIAKYEKLPVNVKNATEQSVLHAIAAWMYENCVDRYSDFRNADINYHDKVTEHRNHILDHKRELAQANGKDYKALVKFGADGELFQHDMLIVMANLYLNNLSYNKKQEIQDSVYAQIKDVYGLLGKSTSIEVLDDVMTYQKASLSAPHESDAAILYWRDMQKKHAKSRFINHYINKENSILIPQVQFNVRNTKVDDGNECVANKPFWVALNYWNCKSANLTIREYVGDEGGKYSWQRKPKETGRVVKNIDFTFGNDEANLKREKDNMPVHGKDSSCITLPAGKYVFVYKSNGKKEAEVVNVSSLRLLSLLDGKNVRCYVLNALTGKPVRGVKVWMKDYDRKLIGKEQKTNVDGEVIFTMPEQKYGNISFYACAGTKDTVFTNIYNGRYHKNDKDIDTSEKMRIYLDRKIYRPGHTVHGYAVVYRQSSKDVFDVVRNQYVKIVCLSNSGDEIYNDSVKTNEFGSADFSFAIPSDVEVGNCDIECECGDCESNNCFSVEEYKRPTWELSLKPELDESVGKKAVTLGDTVMLKGVAKAYSGVPVQGGTVEYTLTRSRQSYQFWRYSFADQQDYDMGSLTVDDDGTFCIPMPLVDDNKNDDYSVLCFFASVKVTDTAGETHEEFYSLRVFKNDFVLNISTPKQIDLSNETDIAVSAIDALDNKVDMDVTFTLSLCDSVAVTKILPANKPFRISELYGISSVNIPVGTYVLKAEATDSRGHKIVSESPVTLFDTNPNTLSKRKAKFASDFFYVPCDTIKNGKQTIAYFCPAYDNVELFMFQGVSDKINRCSHAEYGSKLNILTIDPLAEGDDACSLTIIYAKDGVVSRHSHSFIRETPEEMLVMSWSTFRDHLQPGQQETWKLKVSTLSGKPMDGTELLATMYDASLDNFCANDWSRIKIFRRNWSHLTHSFSRDYVASPMLQGTYKSLSVKGYDYDVFNMFDELLQNRLKPVYRIQNTRMAKGMASSARRKESLSFSQQPGGVVEDAVEEAAPVLHEYAVGTQTADAVMIEDHKKLDVADESALQGKIAGLDLGNTIKVTPRTNFAETAFFYPHLITDKNGEVEISFTLPESLTKWKFLGFAHDTHMKNGMITAEAVAQKQFMVQPQMPRFIRVGDKATIATRIINQSGKALSGKAVMNLLHAKDESLISSQAVDFSVEAGKTTSVSFSLSAMSSDDDIICEIVAEGNDAVNLDETTRGKQSKSKVSQPSTLNSQQFSDGERNLIPVLPSRMLVAESVPFYIKGGEDKTIDLSKLYNGISMTADEKTMDIEFTANPVWTVVDALREIQIPDVPCATSLASSVYANSRLLDLNDKIGQYTEKVIVNKDSVTAKLKKEIADLKALQCNDGSFRWFTGWDRGSYYVTLLVAEQLSKVNGSDEVKSMLEHTLRYLDDKVLENYEWSKAHSKKVIPSESDLHYLAISAASPQREVSSKVRKMRDEYLKYIENHSADLTIYGVSASSNILRAFGHKSSANSFVAIIQHYLVYDEGQGKHFESKRAQYSWCDYRIPTQVAAMNAIYSANPNDGDLADMTLWLLRQKQVQKWENSVNTVNVADIMLKLQEFDAAKSQEGKRVQMQSGSGAIVFSGDCSVEDKVTKHVDAKQVEAICKAPSLIIRTEKANLPNGANGMDVHDTDTHISWGAVSVTFTEDSKSLKSYSTGEVKISRRLMVESNGKWRDLKKGESLNVGQRVRVRHTLRTDRDMDYVRVKTLHPACFEPTDKLSGYQIKGGAGCYQSIHDSYIEMFYDSFREGTSTIDVDYFVTRQGTYNMGITTAECTYAPMFGGHSDGMEVTVK